MNTIGKYSPLNAEISKLSAVIRIIDGWSHDDLQQAWTKYCEWKKEPIASISFDNIFIFADIAQYLIDEGDCGTREVDNGKLEDKFIAFAGLPDSAELREFLSEHDMLMENWHDILGEYIIAFSQGVHG